MKRQYTTQQITEQLLSILQPYVQKLTNRVPSQYNEKRQLLRAALNTLPPFTLNEDEISLVDDLLQQELAEKPVVSVDEIPTAVRFDKTSIKVWQGDITVLVADAIVNAANKELQGCFQPLHMCIDNAIHSASGVRLRDDCAAIIDVQQHPEETGLAKITKGHNLPSRHVIHTVGPIVQGYVTYEHKKLLQQCYLNCLALANQTEGVQSLAFCCISTGVFGYPQQDAAHTAIGTVKKWLTDNPNHQLDSIIFNTFKSDDTRYYRQLLSREVKNG